MTIEYETPPLVVLQPSVAYFGITICSALEWNHLGKLSFWAQRKLVLFGAKATESIYT